MKIDSLGHVVLKVRNLERSEAFYNGLLQIPISARWPEQSMTFFTLGDHHDFAIVAVGEGAPSAAPLAPGLHHVAFKIGTQIDELRECKNHLESAGVSVVPRDHGVTKSINCMDPDGNAIELYVDISDEWKSAPETVAQAFPLEL